MLTARDIIQSPLTKERRNICRPARQRPPPLSRRSRFCQMASAEGSGRGKAGIHKRPGQALDRSLAASSQPNPTVPGQPGHPASDEVPLIPVPLKYVVTEAVKRWFDDTYQEATRGDVKQQALLGQMYADGYGCEKDPRAAKEWGERASSRGYRMQGVYCEL